MAKDLYPLGDSFIKINGDLENKFAKMTFLQQLIYELYLEERAYDIAHYKLSKSEVLFVGDLLNDPHFRPANLMKKLYYFKGFFVREENIDTMYIVAQYEKDIKQTQGKYLIGTLAEFKKISSFYSDFRNLYNRCKKALEEYLGLLSNLTNAKKVNKEKRLQ